MKKYSFTSETQVAANISLCWIDSGREKFPFFLLCFRCRVDRFSDQRDWSCSECPPSFPKKKNSFHMKIDTQMRASKKRKSSFFRWLCFFFVCPTWHAPIFGISKKKRRKRKIFPMYFHVSRSPFSPPSQRERWNGKEISWSCNKNLFSFFSLWGRNVAETNVTHQSRIVELKSSEFVMRRLRSGEICLTHIAFLSRLPPQKNKTEHTVLKAKEKASETGARYAMMGNSG